MTGDGTAEDNSGTLPFHGFMSMDTNAPNYLSPFFNKAGVATEGRTKDIVDNAAIEWRTIVSRYNRGIKVIIQNFGFVIAATEAGGRINDSRIGRMQGEIDSCK